MTREVRRGRLKRKFSLFYRKGNQLERLLKGIRRKDHLLLMLSICCCLQRNLEKWRPQILLWQLARHSSEGRMDGKKMGPDKQHFVGSLNPKKSCLGIYILHPHCLFVITHPGLDFLSVISKQHKSLYCKLTHSVRQI